MEMGYPGSAQAVSRPHRKLELIHRHSQQPGNPFRFLVDFFFLRNLRLILKVDEEVEVLG